MSIIYKIENLVNSKCYIGQSIQKFEKRWQDHKLKLKKGTHWNKHLQSSWNNYGASNFSFVVILCGNFSIEELNSLETSYIKLYNSFSLGYNQTEGGYNSKRSKATRLKMSKIKKEMYKTKAHPWKNRKHTKESKLKMSKSRKGQVAWNKGLPPEVQSTYDATIYCWIRKDGLTQIGTPNYLSVKYNLNRSHVGKLVRGERKTHKKWRLNENLSCNI